MYLRICLVFNQPTKIETHKKYNTFYDKRQKITLLWNFSDKILFAVKKSNDVI